MFLNCFALALTFVICFPLFAKSVEQEQLNFPIQTEALMKGEIHYYFKIISPRKFSVQYSDLYQLDSLSLFDENDVMMVFDKTVYVVNKPSGFFDDKQMQDERYVAYVMGEQKVKKLGADSFEITVPGSDGYRYRIRSIFDSDDISTLPNSKITRAIATARKLDVIAQSASEIMFTEKTHFTKYTEGAITVSSFIPMKENKTLIITYNVWAVKKQFAKKKELKSDYLKEIEAVRNLQNNYK